mgnify:CR=1 FL=1
MRTLNRPMFRYGGPIKEGIMNGIREPKQNGGTIAGGNQMGMPMGNRTGFADPVKAGGYFANLGSKAVGLFNPLKKIKIFGKGLTQIPKYAKDRKSYYDKIPKMERAGMFVRNNPRTTGALAIGATSDPAIGVYKGVGGGLKGIADFLTPGWVQRALEKDKKTEDTENTTLNTDLKKLLEQPAKPKKSEKELRAEQIAKYRDIVDIKGMSKDAAYKSLISASQAVLGEGDIKSSLRDGSLINKIIQGTSQAFDKPSKTKDAIDTLILKSEIEKDLNKDKNAIMDEYRMKQIALADKQLSGGDFAENKGVLAKNMSGQTLFDTAAAKSSPNFMGNLITKKGLTDLMTEAKKSGDIVERDIIINATEELIKGKGIPNGDYTVGDVLVTIVEGKVANVTR